MSGDATKGEVGPRWPIDIRPNGTVLYDGIVIGGLDFTDEDHDGKGREGMEVPRITLDLGWLRAAGVRVRVLGDPRVDRKRGGIILER